ncbi:DnaD domain protein [Viridibacillus arvi]|uniref:DnaD domain-containing protein n=1 Tax=Viridibacillus arvi TaxID=263475 RepID=UPI003D2AA048
MAKYRQVHTTFWDDSFVLDLTPEEKYFYLYLMTNGKTTQCGIYELPYRVIEMHSGYNRETVEKLLQRFVDYGKISYHIPTKEIMINNWARYNFINSPKVKKCIEKELLEVKHKPFVNEYLTSLEQYGYRIDTVSIQLNGNSESKVLEPSNANGSIPYQYPMDSPCIDLGEEEEQEEEQEEEREEEQQQEREQSVGKLADFHFSKIINLFQNNIAPITQFKSEELGMIYDQHPSELAVEAMKETIRTEKVTKPIKYFEGILNSWKRANIKTLQDLETHRKRGENNASFKPIRQVSRNHATNAGTSDDDFYRQLEREKQAWGG